MRRLRLREDVRSAARAAGVAVAGLLTAMSLSGCLVAGYSSRGGGFIWPGGFGLVILVLLLLFFLRRGR